MVPKVIISSWEPRDVETDLRFEKSENALAIILRRNGVSYAVDDTDAM